MLQRILAGSRYFVLIAVIGSFLASLAVLLYGGLAVIYTIVDVFTHGLFSIEESKRFSLECIEIIDFFLLGTVLYIIALGLYELFIDENLLTPKWLVITTLDDLKSKLIGVIIVLLAVTFLGEVVTWNGNANILASGLAVGLVLFALGYVRSLDASKSHTDEKETAHNEQEDSSLSQNS